MPRTARRHSSTGIYHIMMRGINRQRIFEDDEDNWMFLRFMLKYKNKCGYKILAYCLMGNHVHLLMKEGDEPLGIVFKRMGAGFVNWYNVKYQRTGHLFQGRFKSEPVESEASLYAVISYIHQNPVKAGICKNPEEYLYSSFTEYLGKPGLVDMDYVEQCIFRENVLRRSRERMEQNCLDVPDVMRRRVTDQQAKRLMVKISKCANVTDFQALNVEERNNCIREMKESGMTLRQISRMTGVSYYAVQKMTRVNQGTVP